MTWDQRELIESINRKEAGAWKELYRCYYGALCNYAAGIADNRFAAEDIVQECMVGVWNSSLVFAEVKSLTVYLYRSVHNNSLKYLRDKNVSVRRLKRWQEDQEEGEDAGFYKAVEEEWIRKLRMAITELPGQRREVLLLSIEGLSVQQIAERLKISVNTVKTQKKRAYAYLKKNLKQVYFILALLGWLENI